ncbi:hypothetical protein QF026_005655 [Streptomyces aurantiacus]|nr:hypothetical protein [Streptomyces aurantiacus]
MEVSRTRTVGPLVSMVVATAAARVCNSSSAWC